MAKKLAAGLAAALLGSWVALVPSSGAAVDAPARHHAPRLLIQPVSGPLQWFDISYGEVEGGIWRKVTSVSYKVIGCEPGEYLYWADGPAYQDGQQVYGVFGGLGQGEDYCKDDGTSSYGGLWYREPTNLHPGWMTFSVTLFHVDNTQVLASATRRVRIPGPHHPHH